ncbi:NACHT domain-containing NTPase [Nonomuraea sp. NPDC050783]|uniref:NACHT domain-containing protein n=1 Tax=Nonomuraea sp. NPDC050783 TaxID=3154634 RepID=UPI003466C1CF
MTVISGLMVVGLMARQGLPGAKWGDVDPGGLVLGSLGLLVTLVSLVVAWPRGDTDVEAYAAELVRQVEAATRRELQQLLGSDGQADHAEKPIDLEFVRLHTQAGQAEGAEESGTLLRVVDYYRRLRPQRLFILGAPGAGKTVLALHLMHGLLRERDPADRIPVLLPAANWDIATALPRWVAGHIAATYNLPVRAADVLVDAGRILPVIDGLDEMDGDISPAAPSRARRALQALNICLDSHLAKSAVVVTCRTDRYAALDQDEVRAQDAAHIQITPVKSAAAQDFLETRVGTAGLPRWAPVLDVLDFHPDGTLAQALSTPWRLTLAVTIYQERHPDTAAYLRKPADLTKPALDTPQKVADHLLAAYIPAVTSIVNAAGRNPHGYTRKDVHRWLTVLARHLEAGTRTPERDGKTAPSSTGFVLHELWPLAGERPYILSQAITFVPAFLYFVTMLLAVHARFRFTLALVIALLITRMWVVTWPEPWHLDPSVKVRTRYRKAMLLSGLFAAGVFTPAIGFATGWVAGLAGGGAFGIASAVGLGLLARGTRTVVGPDDPIRNDVAGWLMFGLQPVLAGLLAYWLSGGFTGGPWWLAWTLLCFGLMQAGRRAVTRYLMLLVCTRGRLPWRLGRFLRWCHQDAGLLRVSGIAYEFRHRELQAYLAR